MEGHTGEGDGREKRGKISAMINRLGVGGWKREIGVRGEVGGTEVTRLRYGNWGVTEEISGSTVLHSPYVPFPDIPEKTLMGSF